MFCEYTYMHAYLCFWKLVLFLYIHMHSPIHIRIGFLSHPTVSDLEQPSNFLLLLYVIYIIKISSYYRKALCIVYVEQYKNFYPLISIQRPVNRRSLAISTSISESHPTVRHSLTQLKPRESTPRDGLSNRKRSCQWFQRDMGNSC